jgi:uncharacterized ferritin-like protein (DUF455 family)
MLLMRQAAFIALAEGDPARKVALANAAWALAADAAPLVDAAPSLAIGAPGRPARPELLHPADVPRRRMGSPEGRAAMIHAITHIEFNAINLALDAVCRFGAMPDDYYRDWITVAREEAYHFTLLAQHLQTHYGHAYGDFPAHNGLWDMADKTRDDVLVRMALVPRILEARGLDVTPGMRDRLAQHGDAAAAAILDIIFRDEVGHVAIGNRWYTKLCEERRVEPMATFARLIQEHGAKIHPPLNREARLAGGFTAAELDALEP